MISEEIRSLFQSGDKGNIVLGMSLLRTIEFTQMELLCMLDKEQLPWGMLEELVLEFGKDSETDRGILATSPTHRCCQYNPNTRTFWCIIIEEEPVRLTEDDSDFMF